MTIKIDRWAPREALTQQEDMLIKRGKTTKKLFGFLRLHRRELFDDAFQDELAAVYRATGAGQAPHPPALLAMALLLQAYTNCSDAAAVEHTIVDLRWQMVLDCIGSQDAAFSQGALHDFRHRLIRHDLDRRLLERTAEFAKQQGGFDPKKLPKSLRVAIDSKPLQGAGRVEDTLNLLGHAARQVVECAATLLGQDVEQLAKKAGIPLVIASSTKRALDTDWTETRKKQAALQRLLAQLDALLAYLRAHLPSEISKPPLRDTLITLRQLLHQDLEPDPNDPSGTRIRDGVATDRRVSIHDAEMRHGRKTRTKLFNGYKQHLAVDLDDRIILAATVLPANAKESAATPALEVDLSRYRRPITELHIDRGYIHSTMVAEVIADGGEVISKPHTMAGNDGRFTKRDFHFDMRARTVTCPAGQTKPIIRFGEPLEFGAQTCARCPLRSQCTTAKRGRVVQIASDEPLQQRLLRAVRSKVGRQRLRERVPVEHRHAHLAQKQGPRARYRNIRNNTFDVRRHAAVLNLEVAHQQARAA